MTITNKLASEFPHRVQVETAVRDAVAPHLGEPWDVTIVDSPVPERVQLRIVNREKSAVAEFMIAIHDTPDQIREHVRRSVLEEPTC